MAELVGANIASDKPGIGAGAAQVFDTSKLENQLQQQIATERKRQDLQDQANLEALNKIDLNGVRSADQPVVQQKYNAAYQNYRKLQLAQANGDRHGAIQAQASLDASKSDLQSFIGQSKADNGNQALLLADVIHNRNSYTPDAPSKVQALLNTASTNPNYKTLNDISTITKEPAKVDLNAMLDADAKESTVESNPTVVKQGGFAFNQNSKQILYPVLAKRTELNYTKDADTKERIDQVADSMSQDAKDQINTNLVKLGQEPLDPKDPGYAPKLMAADYYLSNGQHYNTIDRKQLTEHVPKAAATIINLGGNGQAAPTVANVAIPNGTKPVKDASGVVTNVPQSIIKQSTVLDGITGPTVKMTLPKSPDLIDASTGRPLQGAGAVDMYGTTLSVRPVYTSGPNKGIIVPDDDKDNAVKNGQAKYQIMFEGNHGSVKGLTPDGDYILSADAVPVYLPASNNAIQAFQLRQSKANQPAVAQKIAQMYSETQQLNNGQTQNTTKQKKKASDYGL